MKANFHQFQPTPIGKNTNARQIKPNTHFQTGKFAIELQKTITQSSNSLSISKHAQTRMQQRNIHIDAEMWTKVQEKVNEAKQMGVKDSLVLLDNAALIVSAKNNVVVTAMEREEARSQIFTNINGTIIME